MPHPFFDKFLQTADNEPAKICFDLYDQPSIASGREISFEIMQQRIGAAAALFLDLKVGKGDIVLIFAQHSLGKLAAFFGAQWIGAIPAFMPPPTVKQDMAAWVKSHSQIIDRIRPALVVSEPLSADHVKALGVECVISTTDVERLPSTGLSEPLPVEWDDIAFLQHSSGTTGLKKGVTVTYRQLVAQIEAYASQIRIDSDCNIISWLPIYHDMGLIAATLLPMKCGVSVKLIDTFAWLSNPSMLIELLASSPKSYCWLPNFAFNYLAKRTRITLEPDALRDVRAVINCSEPCKIADMQAFTNRFISSGLRVEAAQVCYAAAEYVFAMTQTDVDRKVEAVFVDARKLEDEHRAVVCAETDADAKPIVPVGQIVPGAQIRIGVDLPDGEVGEIQIRGPSLCSGYFRNEALSETKFRDGWYHTGDLGFRLGDVFFVTGRMDDLIIVRGKNIYAHDVEAVAGAVPGVKPGRAIAFGIDDKSGTQALAVAVEVVENAERKAVQLDVNAQIGNIFGIVPADVCVVSENTLIKTTSGKISRSENKKRYIEGSLVEYR